MDILTTIFDFANHATGKVIVVLCLIIIILLLLDKYKGSFNKVFRKQELTQYKVEGQKASLDSIAKQIDTIAGNHLHELPEMNKNIIAIQDTLVKIQAKQNTDSDRLSKVEGYLKIGI